MYSNWLVQLRIVYNVKRYAKFRTWRFILVPMGEKTSKDSLVIVFGKN